MTITETARFESSLSSRLSRELLTWEEGHARLSTSVSIQELARTYGTPFYVYDEAILRRQFLALRRALPDEIDIFYSIKANPHPAVIGVFVGLGAGCEVASGGEYVIARCAGAPADSIFFAGPGKGREELDYVISHGIAEIHLESFEEIELIEEIARCRNTKVNVSVRVNPSSGSGGALMMGGQPTVFGFEEEALPHVVRSVLKCSSLNLRGIHLYTATQILDSTLLLEHWRHAIKIARRVSELTQQCPHSVDLGGGLGIPYFDHESELDLNALGIGAKELLASAELVRTRFFVEPGRFLAGPAGIYVAQVRSVKNCRGTTFVVLDGGMNHHLAASGNLGQVVRRDFPVVNLSRLGSPPEGTFVLTGPLCTPIDVMARKVKMPSPKVGDLIGFLQSGAYGLTASPTQFLAHPSPAEVIVSGKTAKLITPRGNPLD
jgi:diaminopimelate decarboxylase